MIMLFLFLFTKKSLFCLLIILKGKKVKTMTNEITIIEKEYLNDLKQIKETIRTNQNKAMVVVNSTMIMTYYEIGTIINMRKVWGNKYIQRLSEDLCKLSRRGGS